MTTETKPAYSPGLAGVVAGETEICWVDPNAGLMYRGYDIHEMAEKANFEEVAYLLLNGELPDQKQLTEFSQQIAQQRTVPKEVLEALRLMPKNTHPMDMLRTGVSMLAPFDAELNDHSHDANVRKAIRLIAKVSTLITDGYRIQKGEQTIEEKPDLPLAANFFYKLTGAMAQDWQIRMMDTIFILYADHEYNASTFAARVTASTLADMYAAVTSACGTLKGPLHGGANEESIYMLNQIATPDRAEAWLMDALAKKAKVMGFGHRVYKSGDSRVPIMREIARDLGKRVGKENWVPICEKLEQTMEREKGLCANVDLYAAPVFTMFGFDPALNTPIFAASRIAGWCAHVIEQHDHNRLIRPRSLYTGPALRPYPGSVAGQRNEVSETKSLQEFYAPANACFGCGPANPEGLHIRSFVRGDEVVAEWMPEKKYEAFPGVLNGGIIGALLDCHCNWTAAWHLMKTAGEERPPCTVTADYAIKLLRPTPTNGPVQLSAKVVASEGSKATVEGTLSGGGKVCATCRGTFVAVTEGHPAFHRW